MTTLENNLVASKEENIPREEEEEEKKYSDYEIEEYDPDMDSHSPSLDFNHSSRDSNYEEDDSSNSSEDSDESERDINHYYDEDYQMSEGESFSTKRCENLEDCIYRTQCKFYHTSEEIDLFVQMENANGKCKDGLSCNFKWECKCFHMPSEISCFMNAYRLNLIKNDRNVSLMCTKNICIEPSKCPFFHNQNDLDNFFLRVEKNKIFKGDCDISKEKFPSKGCSICCEDYLVGQPLKYLSCKHNFHKDCLKKWFQKNKSCPLCRALHQASSKSK